LCNGNFADAFEPKNQQLLSNSKNTADEFDIAICMKTLRLVDLTIQPDQLNSHQQAMHWWLLTACQHHFISWPKSTV